MATKHQGAAPQQRREAAGKLVKPLRNSRRALGDIGNVVTSRVVAEGKPATQITRPITRSFGAQLLRNAQVTAVAEVGAVVPSKKPPRPENLKVEVPVKVDEPVKDEVPAKVEVPTKVEVPLKIKAPAEGRDKLKQEDAVDVKPVINTKPAAVIVISGSSGKSRRKKSVYTLTAVLTARSKAACGIKDRPKEIIHDIDALDADNQLAAVDYVEDIYKFYKLAETLNRSRRNYMEIQVEINPKMRAILVDWLIEVHQKFELTPETLYLTINIIDRYMSMEVVIRRELQLVGIASMLIACKYEEIWAPEVNDFICIADRAYTRERILAMEKEILNKLEWYITVPTPYVFIVRYLKAAQSDKEMECMVFFFAELALQHYSASVSYTPSMLAAAAVYAARCTLNKTPVWTNTLKHHTGYSTAQLHDCATLLVTLHSKMADSKLKVINNKYSNPMLGAVASRSPAKIVQEGSSSGASS